MTPLDAAVMLAIGGRQQRKPPRRGSWRWAWRVLFDRKARARRERRVLHDATLWRMKRRYSQWRAEWFEREFMRVVMGKVE